MLRLIYIVAAFYLTSCLDAPEDFDLENKYDTQNPNYVSPVTTINAGPSEGETITNEEVIFTWTGNDQNMEFRYYLNSILIQDWTNTNSYKLEYLNEGNQIFSVQGKYINEDTSLTVHSGFIVDAVEGPSLIFYPRKQVITEGQALIFEIMAEEVQDLTATEFVLLFDKNILSIDSINTGNIFTLDKNYIFHKKIDNANGKAQLLIGLLGGSNPGFTGTGSLAKVYLTKNILEETTMIFDGSETFRDSLNNKIQINTTIGGLISNE